MIFVVLGTHELPFVRLLKEVERCKKNGIIAEPLIVQSGHTPYMSDVMEIQKFFSYEQMQEYYERASLIITHGGTGSIVTGLKKGKKIIACARLKKYGEHNDDHQLEIIEQFVEKGYILQLEEGRHLEDVLQRARTFEPAPFVSGRQRMIALLRDFIEKS